MPYGKCRLNALRASHSSDDFVLETVGIGLGDMSHDKKMKWLRIAWLYAILAFGRYESASGYIGDAETTTDQSDLSSSLRGETKEFSSSLYEMVPHNVSFHDSKRRLSKAPDRVVFYAMGDTPYGEIQKQRFPFQIQALESRAEFVVHLGDCKSRNADLCTSEEYQRVSSMMQKSAAPVLVVPGDNDWMECNNNTQAYGLWGKHFYRMEQKWSSTLNVRYQDSRPENFAFSHKGVHFVGLHVLFKSFQEVPELYNIVQDDVDWLSSEQSRIYDSHIGAVVLFAHTFPKHNKYAPLYQLLKQTVAGTDKPFIFIQGDLHKFTVSNPFSEMENFLLVSVDMGRNADPMEVAVDVGLRVPFKLKRRPLTTRSPPRLQR